MKKGSTRLLIGLVVLVVGAALGIYGYVTYTNVHASLGGAVERLLTGGSKAETQTIIEMICGGALVIIGLGVMLIRPKRRR